MRSSLPPTRRRTPSAWRWSLPGAWANPSRCGSTAPMASSRRSAPTHGVPTRPGAEAREPVRLSHLLVEDGALHFLNRLGDLDAPGARIGAVEGRPAPERPLPGAQDLQPLLLARIA